MATAMPSPSHPPNHSFFHVVIGGKLSLHLFKQLIVPHLRFWDLRMLAMCCRGLRCVIIYPCPSGCVTLLLARGREESKSLSLSLYQRFSSIHSPGSVLLQDDAIWLGQLDHLREPAPSPMANIASVGSPNHWHTSSTRSPSHTTYPRNSYPPLTAEEREALYPSRPVAEVIRASKRFDQFMQSCGGSWRECFVRLWRMLRLLHRSVVWARWKPQ
jgi:hypothetical protein